MATVDKMTVGRPAPQILAWSRTMFAPALRAAVESLPSSMRHIAGYHLGWWDANGDRVPADGGKAIRPALALLSAEVAGGAPEEALPVAVAVELVHNFSLLHDDVIDRDETRRHRLTSWRVFGVGNAILAGDALLALALDVLAAAGGSASAQLARTLCATVQALIDGQHADVAFESRVDVDLRECLTMAEHKTGALMSCACTLGGLAGGGSPEQVHHLGQFGGRLGLAFQVADDLQGIWGDPRITGKPRHSDLRNRKKSLPVVAALMSGTAAGHELAAWFGSDVGPGAEDLERVAGLVEETGAKEWSQKRIEALQKEALQHLRSARPSPRAFAELATLARLLADAHPTGNEARGTPGSAPVSMLDSAGRAPD